MSIAFEEREDRPAMISFELHPVLDKEKTLKEGKNIYIDIEYVNVQVPYSRDVYRQNADKWFAKQEVNIRNGRIPKKFMEFWNEVRARFHEGLEAPVNGTDIKNWAVLTPSDIKQLVEVKCYTIEDLANCPDDHLKRIGMNGMDLRNKARAYVKAAKDSGGLVLENADLKQQLKVAKEMIETLESQVSALRPLANNAPVVETTAEIGISDLVSNVDEPSERDILSQQYKARFGRLPHGKASVEKIKAQLAEE